jgi:hypothetical protein
MEGCICKMRGNFQGIRFIFVRKMLWTWCRVRGPCGPPAHRVPKIGPWQQLTEERPIRCHSSPNIAVITPNARGPRGESVPGSPEHGTHRFGSAVAMAASSLPTHGARPLRSVGACRHCTERQRGPRGYFPWLKGD